MILAAVPYSVEIVDALTVFVEKKGRWLSITGFDPVRKKPPFVSLVPQILIKISVSYFFKRIDLVSWNEMAVEIHEGKGDLLEDSLSKQVPLYS